MFWTVWLRSLAVLSPFWKAAGGIGGPIPQVRGPPRRLGGCTGLEVEDLARWKRPNEGGWIPSRRADEVRPPGEGTWLELISDKSSKYSMAGERF